MVESLVIRELPILRMRNPAGLNIYVYGCTTGEFLGSYFYKFINLDVCLPHYLKWHRVLKRKWGLGTTGAKKKKRSTKNVDYLHGQFCGIWFSLGGSATPSHELSFSRTLHLLIHLLLYSLILLSMVRTSQTDTHSWFTWLSMMTIIITSFTTSESFIISNKVPYPNLAPCFSMMPILFIQFIIPPIDYCYFLLLSLKASNFQFFVHITVENSCARLIHSPGSFLLWAFSAFSPLCRFQNLLYNLASQRRPKLLPYLHVPCFNCCLTQTCWVKPNYCFPSPSFNQALIMCLLYAKHTHAYAAVLELKNANTVEWIPALPLVSCIIWPSTLISFHPLSFYL